jgi:hypothetical protein
MSAAGDIRRGQMAVGLLTATAALAGCGSSARRSISSELPTPRAGANSEVFSAPNMSVHFDYPKDFQPIRLAPETRLEGDPTSRDSRAAVGISGYDMLIVGRYPLTHASITATNIDRYKPQFDKLVSNLVRKPVSSTVHSVNGVVYLLWPREPISGLPVAVTVQIANAFTGGVEYELQCQATAQNLTKIDAACTHMLATLSTS